MLEVYEVFDASDDVLLAELQSLQQLLWTAHVPSHAQVKLLYDTVRQELEERGLSNKVIQRLGGDSAHGHQQTSPPPLAALGAGWASPAAPAAPLPGPAFGPQPTYPVAMLYSFGSFGAGVNSGVAASPGPYGHHQYAGHSVGQTLASGPNGAVGGSSVAQAVSAKVAATNRQQPGAQLGPLAVGAGLSIPGSDRAYHATYQLATAAPSATAAPVVGKQQPQAPLPQALQPVHSASPAAQPQLQQWPQPHQPPHNSQSELVSSVTVHISPASCTAGKPRHSLSSGEHGVNEGGGGGASSHRPVDDDSGAGPTTPGLAAGGEHEAATPAGEGSSLSGVGGSGAVGVDGATGASAADGGGGGSNGGKALTPWEAAMLAFQEEQRLLRKARKAIKKGPAAKPNAKKNLPVPPPPQQQHARPGALCPESSQGSTRAGGRLPRPSACNSVSSICVAPAASPGPGSGPGARGAGPVSPHGAAALAAGSAVTAAAAAAAVGGGRAAGPPMKASSAPAGAVRQAEPAAAGAGASKAAGPRPATADAPGGAPAGTRPAAPPVEAWADAEQVAEEQGLAGLQAEPAEAAGQQREPSEPESVKTDEESSELLAAAMREAAAAGPNRRTRGDTCSSSDSEPESISSASESEGRRSQRAEAGKLFQMSGGPLARSEAAKHVAGTAARVRALSASQLPPGQQLLRLSSSGGAAQHMRVPTPPTAARDAQQHQAGTSEDIADIVATESESESDSDAASTSGEGPSGLGSPGRRREGTPSHTGQAHRPDGSGDPLQAEARRRAIAAAAAAAIHGRSAAEPLAPSLAGADAQFARAAVQLGPMKVDRWADWELADSSDALSAWATNHEEDPMRGGHLRGMVRRVGQHAPPESLAAGPTGAHGLGASALQQAQQQAQDQQLPLHQASPSRVGAGGSGESRPGSRPDVGSPARAVSAGNGGGKASPAGRLGQGAANDRGRAGSGDSSSSDGDGDADGDGGYRGGAAQVRQRGHSAGPRDALTPSSPLLPRSGMVPAGSVPGSLASATAASGSAGSTTRRPPLPPGSAPQRAPQATERTQPAGPAAAPQPPRSGGSGSPSPAAEAPLTPTQPATAPSTASSAYLQHYSAFHEVLTACYSALPVMMDAAALASSSVAVVAGSGGCGGGGSRPPSRMVTPSVGAVAGVDLIDRYANLLARCEAWQAKLRLLTHGSPYDDGSGPTPTAATAAAGLEPAATGIMTSGTQLLPSAAASLSSGAVGGDGQNTSGNASTAATRLVPLPPPAPTAPTAVRYVAIVDDTAHPEVRNVVNAAVRLLSPAWALDPADQVTEVAKADASPDDDAAGPAAAGGGSRPATATTGVLAAASGSRASFAGGFGSAGQAASSAGTASFAGGGGGGAGGGSSGGGARCHMWNVLWSWSVRVRVPVGELLVWQRVNHFAEARQLTRKDLLKKHLAKYQAMHNTGRSAALFDRLSPTTFVLPKEAAAFEEAFVRALHGVEATCVQPMGLNLWIQKPVGLSRGRGISLISSLKKVNTAEPMIVQRYLTEPLLVEGYKFDLRLYVLVTSFNPLEAWLHEEGFARFTTLPYTLDESELGNMHVHLTNSSVQRSRAEAGQLPAFLQAAEPAGGSKTSLATLRRLLGRQGADWATLWTRVSEVATAALFAAQDAIPHSPNSFELFGFDMMIDAQQKVWLLEVNSSPSMGLDTPLDRAVKPRLIADVLELLAPLPFDRQALAAVLRSRTSTGRSSRRGAQGLLSGTVGEERELCCTDLQAVLGGAMPRRYGERPRNPGGFTTCLAPSPFHDRLLRLRRPLP